MGTLQDIDPRAPIRCHNAEGKLLLVWEDVTVTTTRTLSGLSSKAYGNNSFRTESGNPLNYIDTNTFKDVLTDEILTRI